MKLVIQVQLLPDAVQAKALRETVERFNEAAAWVVGVLFEKGVTNKRVAQQLVYHEIRERFTLTAQTAILVIHRVCEALKRDKTIRPTFRPYAAMTYDSRVMKFIGLDTVNLWTVAGRLTVPILIGAYQAERIGNAKGQCDLILRGDGKWFLIVTVDVPEGTAIPVTDFIGVDLGLANIATDSDPETEPYSGEPVERIRHKHNLQRKRLQKRGTKGANKKLKRMSGKEARFRNHENHCISKKLVTAAKGTGAEPPSRIGGVFATGSRLGAETRSTGFRAGRSRNWLASSHTRPHLRACPSRRWTRATHRGRARHVAIARRTTGSRKRNSCACRAG